MELKTLKDITYVDGVINKLGTFEEFAKEIKKEAIKWVKYLIDKHNHVGEKFWIEIDRKSYQEGTTWIDYDEEIQFIKHFFNITEEDLR